VGGISERDVAERAGVSPGDLAKLIAAGILVPGPDGSFADGDARRARMYRSLEQAGLPIETLATALQKGEVRFDFLDLPVYDRFAGLEPRTFRDVSAEEGIPIGLLLVIREAIGLAQASPDDQMREDELRVVPLLRFQLAKGFDPVVLERMLRVYGDTLRRLTESEAEWWRSQILEPNLSSGKGAAEILEIQAQLGEAITPLIEEAMLAIYHANQEHAWNETLVELVEDALDRAGLWSRLVTSPAICFLDLAGFTRLTEERGDLAAADLAEHLAPIVQRLAERHGGKVVKLLGDGVMFHFRDAAGAVTAALEMRDAVEADGLPQAHLGVHTGPVVFQGGDYFGRTVNLAARIVEQAQPGQVLASRDVMDAVGAGAFGFEPFGTFELRGVSEPVPLFAVTR
jgi:class 3 adenylate cyclase